MTMFLQCVIRIRAKAGKRDDLIDLALERIEQFNREKREQNLPIPLQVKLYMSLTDENGLMLVYETEGGNIGLSPEGAMDMPDLIESYNAETFVLVSGEETP